MTPANERYPLFDSLRAIAALMVVVCHLSVALAAPLDGALTPYLINMNSGIAVFFLISGFLLYRPFVQSRYEHAAAPGTATYAQRRLLRIVPAYWVALVAVVLLLGRSGESATADPVFTVEGAIRYFGFLQVYDSDTLLGGISAAWTLCVEVAFYAFLPLWALLMRRIPCRSRAQFVSTELLGLGLLFLAGLAFTAFAAAKVEPTAGAIADPSTLEPWLYLPPDYLDHFALGMLLAVVSVAAVGGPAPGAVRLVERAPWLPWLVAAGAYVVLVNLPRWLPGEWVPVVLGTHVLQGLLGLGLLLPAVFGDPERGALRRLLSNRVLLWIGLVSYGLYLWHVAVNAKLLDWGVRDELGSAGFVAVAVAASLLMAAASFYLIERHALRLGRRLSRRRSSQDADMRARDLARHELPAPAPEGSPPPLAAPRRQPL